MNTTAKEAYERYRRRVIIEIPRYSVEKVLDVEIDPKQDLEKTIDKGQVANVDKKDKITIVDKSDPNSCKKTLSDVFGEVLKIGFRSAEAGDVMYAPYSCENDGVNQQYIICIATNENADIPVKVVPLIPSGMELFGYTEKKTFRKASTYNVKMDKDNPGEVYLNTMRMERIIRKYKIGEVWTKEDVEDYVREIKEWTIKMTTLIRKAVDRRGSDQHNPNRRFTYANNICKKCKRIIISDRAYISILAEALSRDPLETGGILLGHYEKDTWYVVEATDPGLSTIHNTVHHEMDDKYHNHIYPVISRLYDKDLSLVGLWHRHPGTYNSFSSDDNKTNTAYSEAIGNGTLSFLLNFVPNAQLTCYYFDHTGTGAYYKPEVKIGDKYFRGTDYLSLANEKTLNARKMQLRKEIEHEK